MGMSHFDQLYGRRKILIYGFAVKEDNHNNKEESFCQPKKAWSEAIWQYGLKNCFSVHYVVFQYTSVLCKN